MQRRHRALRQRKDKIDDRSRQNPAYSPGRCFKEISRIFDFDTCAPSDIETQCGVLLIYHAAEVVILRIMGIDFGDARVGLAISDPTQTLAGGIGFVSVSGVNSAVKAVCEKITETGAETAVCGLPLNMNGTEGERAQKVRAFAKLLEEKSGIPVIMVDERRTTIMAHGFMNETGTHGKKRKLAVDTLSAQIILQTYLDMQKDKCD